MKQVGLKPAEYRKISILHCNKDSLVLSPKLSLLPIDDSNWCSPYPIGHNCPKNTIIDTEEGCKRAAMSLGLHYMVALYEPKFAAGCYSIQNDVWFNTIIDTSLTNPESVLLTGGVCLNRGAS